MFKLIKTAVTFVSDILFSKTVAPTATTRMPVLPSFNGGDYNGVIEAWTDPTKTPKPALVACKKDERLCKECAKPFKPARHYYRVCQDCFGAQRAKELTKMFGETVEAPPAVVVPSSAPLPSEKDVMRAWAKQCFEEDNLPEGTKIVRGGGGKVTLTLGNRVAVFSSQKPRAATTEKPAIAEAPRAGAAGPKSEPTGKSCLKCQTRFIPAKSYFNVCPACHRGTGQIAKPATQHATRPPMSEHELQALFAKLAQASYEASKIPEGVKYMERLGGQVVFSALGMSATFISDSLRGRQEAVKRLNARLAAEAREHELYADSVRTGWAKECFEAENLPEGAVAKPAGEGKVAVTCEGKTVTFRSGKRVITAEAEKPAPQKRDSKPRESKKGNKGKQAVNKKAA